MFCVFPLLLFVSDISLRAVLTAVDLRRRRMLLRIVGQEDAKQFAKDYTFMSLAAVSEGGLEAKQFTDKSGKTEVKTLDGRPQLRTQLKCIRKENGEPAYEEQNVSVALLTQPKGGLLPGGRYVLMPPLQFVHYTTASGRVGVSIVAETVVPEPVGQKAE